MRSAIDVPGQIAQLVLGKMKPVPFNAGGYVKWHDAEVAADRPVQEKLTAFRSERINFTNASGSNQSHGMSSRRQNPG